MDNVVMELTDAKIAEIKSRTMDKFFLENRDDGLKIYRADIDKYDYCEIADIDCKTVERLGSFYGILEYFENGGQFTLNCETYINDDLEVSLSTGFKDCRDFLELFSKEKSADNSTELTVKELFNKYTDEIADYIRENYSEVWSNLKTVIFDNMDKDDVPGNIEEDIVDTWIENNCDDAFDKVMDYCSSSDLCDYAHQIIDKL